MQVFIVDGSALIEEGVTLFLGKGIEFLVDPVCLV